MLDSFRQARAKAETSVEPTWCAHGVPTSRRLATSLLQEAFASAFTRERQPGETCASELVSSTPAWRAGVERHQFGRSPYTEGGSGARVPNRTGRHLASVRS